jgi:hypothetical protein
MDPMHKPSAEKSESISCCPGYQRRRHATSMVSALPSSHGRRLQRAAAVSPSPPQLSSSKGMQWWPLTRHVKATPWKVALNTGLRFASAQRHESYSQLQLRHAVQRLHATAEQHSSSATAADVHVIWWPTHQVGGRKHSIHSQDTWLPKSRACLPCCAWMQTAPSSTTQLA